MALRFSKPTVSRVRSMLSNPAYAGMYVYGRRQWRAIRAGAEPAPPHRVFGQCVVQDGHHEPYITPEQFEAFEKLLAVNRHGPSHSLLGPGPALLQGLVRHAAHGAMSVAYTSRPNGRHWYYRCMGDYLRGGKQCITVPGPAIDAVVAEAFLRRLDAQFVDDVHRQWLAQQRDWQRRQRQADDIIVAKERELDRLRRKLLDDDDCPRSVRAMFGEEYERLSGELQRLRCQPRNEAPPADPFSRRRWERLRDLCERADEIWRAPTTEDHDRKQLARTLVRAVVIQTASTEELTLTIDWIDDALPADLVVRRAPYYHRLISELRQAGRSVEEIAQTLGDMGAKTQQGNDWSVETVRRTINYRLQATRSAEDAA